MPTGYTASVADGTVTDLKTFALTLARGMGALVMMRDEPWDAPVPEKFEPSSYHADRLKEVDEAHQELVALELDPERLRVAMETELAIYNDLRAKALYEHNQKRARYQAMIEKVTAWQGAPEGIKEFALSQLRDSMDFDCREPFKFWEKEPETDPGAWLAVKFAQNKWEYDYHTKNLAEEEERVEGRNAWLAQLRESLK